MRKIFSAALALVCIWFASPSWAACNLFDPSLLFRGYWMNNPNGLTQDNNYRVVSLNLNPGTYTFSTDVPDTRLLRVYVNGAYQEFQNPIANNKYTFTVTQSGLFSIVFRGLTAATTIPYETQVQIEEGSTATPYQPYDATCIERCKNLLNPNSLVQRGIQDNNGATATENEKRVAMIDYIPVTPGQRYIFSSSNSDIIFHGSYFYDENKNHLLTGQHSRIATVPENAKYMRFSLQVSDGSNPLSVQDVLNANPQLELGSTATEYVPYNAACHNNKITIATTKYNETAFSPLNTALQNAISVVDTVVSNTITQAGRIATLQAQKQTRPNDIADDNEKCPAGKKCLLVEDASGVPHWYEIVTSILPDGYTELQYIESTGTQYIDTGVNPTNTTETMVVGQYTELSGNASIFGALESNGRNYYGLGLADSGTKWRLWYGSGGSPWVIFGTPNTDKHTFLLKNKSIYIDNLDTPIAESDLSCSSQTKTMFLFGANSGGSLYTASKTKIFSAVIKDNNTLIRDMIPAKNPDGKIGMYDLANGVFYENAGTGEFIAGDPVAE